MKCVIISGGHIDDVFALNWLQNYEYDYMIAADSGMNFLYRNQIVPDVIAGDFDSVDERAYQYFAQGRASLIDEVGQKNLGKEAVIREVEHPEILRLNPIKDDTDTEFVIREAIRRGATSIVVLGATGTRLDHVLANVYLLGIGIEEGVEIQLVDAHNRIRMITDSIEIRKEEQFGEFVSVLPVKGDAKGVTLNGMKYPLDDAYVGCFSSLGVSNEIYEDVARISVKKGTLLVIESRD